MGWWDLEILNIPKAMLPEVRSTLKFLRQDVPFLRWRSANFRYGWGTNRQPFGQLALNLVWPKNTMEQVLHHYEHWWRDAVVRKQPFDNDWLWDQRQGLLCLEGSIFIAGVLIVASWDELHGQYHQSLKKIYFTSRQQWRSLCRTRSTGLGLHTGIKMLVARSFWLNLRNKQRRLYQGNLGNLRLSSAWHHHTMQWDAQTAIQVLKVDGGAAMNNFLMQFQLTFWESILPVLENGKQPLGAAFLAGLSVGYWSNELETLEWDREIPFRTIDEP